MVSSASRSKKIGSSGPISRPNFAPELFLKGFQTEPFENAAALIGRPADTTDDVVKVVTGVAAGVDDEVADWLVERADSPGAWVYAQVCDQ